MSAHSSINSRPMTRGRRQPSGTVWRSFPVRDDDAYEHALRAAYLAYLLLPRAKRVQHVPAGPTKVVQRSATNIQDMVRDLNLLRDSKSTRFPHGFMNALDKRISGVLVGTERGAEYSDALVKRSFANFLNAFKEPSFRKTMEKDRRVEDLLLIFFSRATAELQKGKQDDDSWKWMVDRHVALFVRLISSTLHNNDWTRDRPELSSRLKTLETKLLQHDQDLADERQRNGGQGGQSIEVEVPRSYEVRDMPLVLRVCSVFGRPPFQAQADIDAHRNEWTEQAALRDLKEYQNQMSLNNFITLTREDFATDEAFESWRKSELSDLSGMMLALVQSNPDLAGTSTDDTSIPQLSSPVSAGGNPFGQDPIVDNARPNYLIDLPLDMSGLGLEGSGLVDSDTDTGQVSFTFIPPDARAVYRAVLRSSLNHDIAQVTNDDGPKLLSKQSSELLNELAARWRVPAFTHNIIFMDVICEKFQHQELDVETLDAAFMYLKEPPMIDSKKGRTGQTPISLGDKTRWTLTEYSAYRQILGSLHEALLKELFELFQHCYENKAPSIGSVMYVLENHIYDDEAFGQLPEDLDAFSIQLEERLREKARDKYAFLLKKHVSDEQAEWEFYNIIQLGKAVIELCEKIKKRYRNNPEVMGVNPLSILAEETLPSFVDDTQDIVKRIMEDRGEDEAIHIQDGFDLYDELVKFRQYYAEILPTRESSFHVEGLLQSFVWRWIALTDGKINDWVANAVSHDEFQLAKHVPGSVLSDAERHSQSVVDVYQMFNQSIDQIANLKWDDDLQYAKFMTAISKSIGRGVAKYCDLLETQFIKEMDRQTPEQEAKAQQTQRDKWIAVAKEAWTTGGKGPAEKIEPFQFWPESFVKLNDIEYAILQLDNVEKEMNVDACAEVINRIEPPPPPNIRNGRTKFLFTIKIIEAEDLKAGDSSGYSDPYVVLGDEYQKRLAKTRTVYSSLNPRWDESFDILTTGPLNVIATIWDWDMLGDHDCLGRTSLKLDPSHFNDYLPREYWLDLDTQGRVLVRVSMEGERDDIQFHFGKAFRTLKRTERDMARKVTDKLSAYIQQCLSRRTLRSLLGQTGLGGVAKGYFSKLSSQVAGRPVIVASLPAPTAPTNDEIDNALKPLLNYFDDNFAIMKQTLTDSGMIMIMTRLWKEVLVTIESLLVPPLSDKLSAQRPLTQQEVDIAYRWLSTLFDFFHAYDEDDKTAHGVPLDVLKSPKYHDLQNLNFFYSESTENLIRTSDSIAQATARRQQTSTALPQRNRFSAPPGATPPFDTLPGARRSKTIMSSRNLGTMRAAKRQKRAEAQADPSDDMILRILRMRPEAEKYLKDRSRQKERLAAAAAAEAIVRQSLLARGKGGMQQASQQRVARWDTIRE
ncbi:hypothetical protein K470DRAFT_213627 [Piedraia hortae CBS 480.64]|uniref:C2 domain protein n=1 Tax=Piedraia hortae CBS 480.64 TaxID=1314780 RepID=A0A6A7C5Q4_9PEZI|nr:hypothetical protein K470DRAFT_213627 [Piedraia hortae CBS 480.64]